MTDSVRLVVELTSEDVHDLREWALRYERESGGEPIGHPDVDRYCWQLEYFWGRVVLACERAIDNPLPPMRETILRGALVNIIRTFDLSSWPSRPMPARVVRAIEDARTTLRELTP